ncbi:MAG: DegT/DnrJ/EryC1/StrS family aminotransferase [Candidatus Omnitrophota bacterium]
MDNRPAILGGDIISPHRIPFVRPSLPPLNEISEKIEEALTSGMVTTGPYAEQLGEEMAHYMGVKNAVAVSSCTTGLMLAIQALGLPEGSEVVLPSFTFIASGLGLVWNRLKLRFADVDVLTMNIDPQSAEEAITANTSAILGVHQFGNPAPIEDLQRLADRRGLRLFFDSAHGLGSWRDSKPLGGFGSVEVFSLSPTKLTIAAEGGIVATNDDDIARHVRLGRNYANPGNYDCLFPGINARMSELHAILALSSFKKLGEASQRRNQAVKLYRERLGRIPGLSFQKIAENDRSSYKDFSIVVDETEFGLTQRRLAGALLAEDIQTRIYYSPILHQMTAFRSFADKDADARLKNSLYLESHALSLPLFSDMKDDEVEIVCAAIERIHSHAKAVNFTFSD